MEASRVTWVTNHEVMIYYLGPLTVLSADVSRVQPRPTSKQNGAGKVYGTHRTSVHPYIAVGQARLRKSSYVLISGICCGYGTRCISSSIHKVFAIGSMMPINSIEENKDNRLA